MSGQPSDKRKHPRNQVIRGVDVVVRDGTVSGALPAVGHRNGLPELRPYRWRGCTDDPAAIVARLHEQLAAQAEEPPP